MAETTKKISRKDIAKMSFGDFLRSAPVINATFDYWWRKASR